VLESHLFLKENRDLSRRVAGGNKQRGTSIDKDDATSPTAALESVLLTAMIDAAGMLPLIIRIENLNTRIIC
jgi:hypothetical protein